MLTKSTSCCLGQHLPVSLLLRFITSREMMSLQTLTGLRVAREAIQSHGGADNVNISSSLISSHVNARAKYHERLDKERKEKEEKEKYIRENREAARKRKAQEEEKEEFNAKIKRYETEEKALKAELKEDEKALSEIDHHIANTSVPAIIHSKISIRKKVVECIAEKKKKLEDIVETKYKLAKSRANKVKQ